MVFLLGYYGFIVLTPIIPNEITMLLLFFSLFLLYFDYYVILYPFCFASLSFAIFTHLTHTFAKRTEFFCSSAAHFSVLAHSCHFLLFLSRYFDSSCYPSFPFLCITKIHLLPVFSIQVIDAISRCYKTQNTSLNSLLPLSLPFFIQYLKAVCVEIS